MTDKAKSRKPLLLIIYLIAIVLIVWALMLMGQRIDQVPDRILNVQYEVALMSSQFEHLWTTSPVFNHHRYDAGSIHLDATGGYAFLLGSVGEDKSGDMTLTKLDMLTGTVEWFQFDPSTFSKGSASTLDVNSKLVYVGFEGTQKIDGDTRFGAASVRAYEIESGHMIWSKIIPGARGIESLVATDSTVSVYGDSSSSFYLFDTNNGNLIDAVEKEGANFIFFIDESILYERQKSISFQARGIDTNSIIWQSDVGYPVLQSPILMDNAIVACSGDLRSTGSAFAIDKATGHLLWEYKDVRCNIAVGDSVAFFLTKDIELMAVDIETGELLGQVSFLSDLEQDRIADVWYSVAASGDTVLVYFEDSSSQIFAFRFTP